MRVARSYFAFVVLFIRLTPFKKYNYIIINFSDIPH
jgi:hypothetical protein